MAAQEEEIGRFHARADRSLSRFPTPPHNIVLAARTSRWSPGVKTWLVGRRRIRIQSGLRHVLFMLKSVAQVTTRLRRAGISTGSYTIHFIWCSFFCPPAGVFIRPEPSRQNRVVFCPVCRYILVFVSTHCCILFAPFLRFLRQYYKL